jgi:hypothetical protein
MSFNPVSSYQLNWQSGPKSEFALPRAIPQFYRNSPIEPSLSESNFAKNKYFVKPATRHATGEQIVSDGVYPVGRILENVNIAKYRRYTMVPQPTRLKMHVCKCLHGLSGSKVAGHVNIVISN